MPPLPVAVPKAGPAALPELAAFLAPFGPLFRRRESRESLERYLTGLLTDLPRKNCDAIAAALAGTSTERLQHLLTDADWDPQAFDKARVGRLTGLSLAGGVLVLDDTGLPKRGLRSVGVAAQYSGTLGTVANCQVIVSTEYGAPPLATSAPRHWPVSARLYLPRPWAADQERRRRAHVPEAGTFQTKPELALELIDQARAWRVPFSVVVPDAGSGDKPNFLAGLDDRHCPSVCAGESPFGVRLPDAVQAAAAPPESPVPTKRGRGRPKLPRPAPLHTAKAITAALADDAWQSVTWREGTTGPWIKQFAASRVHWATGTPEVGPHGRSAQHGRMRTGPAGWRIAERPLPGDAGDQKWYFSNLPPETPLERRVALAHARWPIEPFSEDAKGEGGLDDYQGRRWDGLHRHLALAMPSYSFLVLQRTAPNEGGLSPLTDRSHPAGWAPLRPRLAPPRSGPVVYRHRPDRSLPSPS